MKKASRQLINKYAPRVIGFRLNSLFLIQPEKALIKAYKLFSSPRRGQVKPNQKSFLNAAKSTSIEHDSKTIQTYQWKGNGKTVILVHGWDSNSYRWKDLIEDLQKENYNIIAFDAPAHGFSGGNRLNVLLYSDCLNQLLELYRPEFLIGHSMGGMTVVYNQSIKQSPFLKKIVLLGAPSEMKIIMRDYQRILKLSDKFMSALDGFFKQKFDYTFTEFSIAEFAKRVEKDALIIHDEFDKIAPVEAAKAIHHSLKHSRLIVTEGAGHSLNTEKIRQAILKFINQDS